MALNYQLPLLCAKCAQRPPVKSWLIRQAERRLNPWSILTAAAGIYLFRRTTYTFAVPLCDSCWQQMRRWQIVMRIIQLLGIAIMLGGLYVSATGNTTPIVLRQTKAGGQGSSVNSAKITADFDPGVPLLALGVIVFGVAQFIVPRLGTYDGDQLSFRNPTFHDAFAVLNPKLVKPREEPPTPK